MNDIGHNSGDAAGQIKSFVERAERLHEERASLADDLKELWAEAKSAGFDARALKHIVSLRAKDADALREFDAVVDLYKSALGMA